MLSKLIDSAKSLENSSQKDISKQVKRLVDSGMGIQEA
jgi:hypothetical protein